MDSGHICQVMVKVVVACDDDVQPRSQGFSSTLLPSRRETLGTRLDDVMMVTIMVMTMIMMIVLMVMIK